LAQPVQPSGPAKLPNDTFVTANQKENTSIYDYNAQSIDPISSIKQAYRASLFSSTKTEINERLAEVMAVDMTIKKPSDLNYFGEASISVEYGDRDWVSVICRVMDLHSGVPDPEQTLIQGTTTLAFTDITRLRSNVGKFYAPMDDLRNKGASNIEVGDWLIVEFQDKTTLSNGIIKDVYFKKDISTYTPTPSGGGSGGPSGEFNNPSSEPVNLPPLPGGFDVKDFDPKGLLNDSRCAPKVRELAIKVGAELQAQGFRPYLMQTYRSPADQLKVLRRGTSSATFSYHQVGLAVDIVHWNAKHTGPTWLSNDANLAKQFWPAVGRIGKAAGFTEWGGDWKSRFDGPHLEYHPSGLTESGAKRLFNGSNFAEVWAAAERR